MNVLVTGGAGYIGSFMTQYLIDRGHEVTIFDNLERGHEDALDVRAKFTKGDLRDSQMLSDLFSNNKFDAVLHFAGLISVEESTREQDLYYQNNVVGSQNLFNAAKNGGVNKIIFSSTAAVYGNPTKVPIPEDHAKNPTSPYGATKLETESYLTSMRKSDPSLSFACLRYFNAAGAALNGELGEAHMPETHIIPLAIRAVLAGQEFKLYGTDYNTADGTCIRDYIHVLDLVEAHLLALEKLSDGGGYFYNVGTGKGYSNREVVSMVEKVSGVKIKLKEEGRRAGDPDQLIADPERIRRELNFNPKHSDLEMIIESAWKWHKNQNGS